MRIGADLLDDAITSRAIGIDDAIKQRAFLRILERMIEIAPFLVAKRLAIGDEKLEVARAWLIDVRVVDLVHDPVRKREPQSATGVIRGADSFLCALRPTRGKSRRAERCAREW